MRCSQCGFENREGARFCVECGATQAAACPQCSHGNPPGSRFCEECGTSLLPPEPRYSSPQDYTPAHLKEKILASRGEMEGERKHVTILFADFSGFTPRSSGLDPEEVHRVTNRWFDLMLEEVHLHEGTVTQFRGDGIMALFGAPIAHEDHALRAVRAALGIQRSIQADYEHLRMGGGEPMELRVGLNSGPVVVGNIGTDLSMTYTALGDTVNIADRIQSVCRTGSVAISDATRRLVEGLFVLEDMGPKELKGIPEPLRVYEVLRPVRWRSRIDLYAERGLTPFVGREKELETLLDSFERVKAGQGQMVFISGEPGIGKSRLLYEFKKRLEGEDLAWLEGRCISYGKEMSYLPVIDTLKDSFDIQESDSEPEIIEKVDRQVLAMGGELAAGLPYLKLLLSVDPGDPDVLTMDPQLRKANIFEAVRALAIRGSQIRPVINSVEDLHWMDRLSEEYISYVSDTVSQHRILMLLTYRTGYDFPFGERPYYTHIHLGSLSEHESAEMAEGMLAAKQLPAELQRIIAAKAEGNPFFVEEVIKSLLEEGAVRRSGSAFTLARPGEAIDVPDTVEGVIMARLDRLEQEAKRAIQTAAVIGREFTVRLLERTAEIRGQLEEYLKDLKSLELIYERSLYPELAYMFKHALTHDVAYNSLLGVRRRALHHMVGTAVEDLYADRLTEHSEMLAHHFERAEVWEKALEYLAKAGDKAISAHDPRQAIGFFDRALEAASRLPDPDPETLLAVHEGKANAHFLVNEWDRSVESSRHMLSLAQEIGDKARQGQAQFWLAWGEFWAHRFETALEHAEKTRAIAAEAGNEGLEALASFIEAFVHGVTGNLDRAGERGMSALSIADRLGDHFLGSMGRVLAGLMYEWQGKAGDALAAWKEGEDLAAKVNSVQPLFWLPWDIGLGHCLRGEYEKALESLRGGLEFNRRVSAPAFTSRILNTIGWVHMEICDWDTAIRYNEEGAAEAYKLGDPEIMRNAEINLGDCYLALGDLDRAQKQLEEVYQQSQRRGEWGEEWMKWRYTQHLYHSLGEVWLARGDPEQAHRWADECLELAEPTESRKNIVKARRLKAQAYLAQEKPAEAEKELDIALQLAAEVGNPTQLWKTHVTVGDLRSATGHTAEAAEAYREALSVIEDVAANLTDRALRDTFLASKQVQDVRDAVAAAGRDS